MKFFLEIFFFFLLVNRSLQQSPDDDVTNGVGARDPEYEGYDPLEERSALLPLDVGLAAIYGVITVVGLLANGVVFFVIFAGGEISKTVTAMYVLQLAVADSLFLMTLPIFGLQKLLMTWPFGRGLCSVCIGLKFFNYYAGILFLTAMSVDRYIAVAYSTRSHQLRTRKRTMVVCALVWLVAGVITVPTLVFTQVQKIGSNQVCRLTFPGSEPLNLSIIYVYEDVNETSGEFDMYENEEVYDVGGVEVNETEYYDGAYVEGATACKHHAHGPSYPAWLVSNFILMFVLPFVVITISYALIVKQLRVSEDKVANMTGKRTANMRKRVTRMVAALVICFVICWLPHQIFSLVRINGVDVSASSCFAWEQILAALGFSNSAINPLLYTFLGQNFGDRLRHGLALTRRRLRRGSSLPPTAHAHGAANSENQNYNMSKRLSNFIGTRRASKQSSEPGNSPYDSGSNGFKKGRIPLFEIKKNNGKRSRGASEAENVTRSQLNQTECTGLINDVRDTNVDDVTNIERQVRSV